MSHLMPYGVADAIFSEGLDEFTDDEIDSILVQKSGWEGHFHDEAQRSLDAGWIDQDEYSRRMITSAAVLRDNLIDQLTEDESFDEI